MRLYLQFWENLKKSQNCQIKHVKTQETKQFNWEAILHKLYSNKWEKSASSSQRYYKKIDKPVTWNKINIKWNKIK